MSTTRWFGLVLAAWVLTPARAVAAPVATGIRVADHPGYVRVVVDFRGALPTPTEQVEATDPDPFGDGRASIRFTRTGVRTTAVPVNAHGLRAAVQHGPRRITVRVQAAAARRFKYASHTILHGPERIVVDLFKSAPPVPPARPERVPAPDERRALGAGDRGRRARAEPVRALVRAPAARGERAGAGAATDDR